MSKPRAAVVRAYSWIDLAVLCCGSNTPAEDAAVNIRAVVEDLKRGKRYAELIGVDGQNGDIILMEGQTRATAYAAAQLPDRIDCLVGSSPSMSKWSFY